MAVQFFLLDTKLTLAERKRLKSFITALIKRKGRKLQSLNYIFCSDDHLLEINRNFLKHDYYTDIITFDLSAPGEDLVGEIYISIDRVKDNAKQLRQSIKQELHRVIFHGALHLCGYKDKTPEQKTLMTRAENSCLRQYFS